MNSNIRKIIARSATVLVAGSILAYIFWPEQTEVAEPTETTISEPATTTTSVKIDESACLVLFVKDSDQFLINDMPCLDTYIERVTTGFYASLNGLCRSSGDGSKVDRQKLSEQRAASLQFHLMKMGVKYEDINIEPVSDGSPYAGVDPSTEEGKVLNRSCEITGEK